MRKIISILLLVLYSTTSFAIAIDVHFCGGKFSGISFPTFGLTTQCGCDHSKPDHKSCCTDKIISSKTDSHITIQPYVLTQSWAPAILAEFPGWLGHKYNQPEENDDYKFPSGFIRSHFHYYLAFLCIFRN